MLVSHHQTVINVQKDDVSWRCFTTKKKVIIISISDWNQFVTNKLWAWEQTNLAWSRNFTGDLHVVFYDRLVDDVEGTLRGILNFIEFPINEVKQF